MCLLFLILFGAFGPVLSLWLHIQRLCYHICLTLSLRELLESCPGFAIINNILWSKPLQASYFQLYSGNLL